ncbi:MAG: acylneuraminate cytidylyltransferase family protein [Sandarakinorhabdus sp.]|nr:acylneuraminate cytidylyltransferase family protein [Sandarakinorhabdus sp.]
MSVLALIPARGGSKGIPRKNITPIAGRPLIAWTITAALAARVDAVMVSTDDEEIAEIARAAGAIVPFLRPAELARDATPGLDPVLHALDGLPGYDSVVLLQPTSPLRGAADIDAALALKAATGAASVVSVTEPATHPYWVYSLDADGRMAPLIDAAKGARRQDLPVVHALNGAMYLADAGWLRAGRRFVDADTRAFVMPPERSVDIDTPFDWLIAEALLQARESIR